MQFVIVESPTKAKTLKKFLGKGYLVDASMGHVGDLPKSKLSVDVDNKFEPVYETVKGRGKTITKLRKQAKEATTVYLAMDPDREGEAIAYHVAYLLSKSKKDAEKGKLSQKFRRVSFHEITKSAIEEAMQNPMGVNMDLVDAQQARRVLDRLVGYSLSPVLWRKVRRGLSAGRVQSVALRMIVEREAEIEKFKPQVYFEIVSQVANKKKEKFEVSLFEKNGKTLVVKGAENGKKEVFVIETEKDAKEIVADLEKSKYQVEKIDRKERKRNPYPPYTTSTLQQAASNTMGWSGRQTMRIAQQLYEAGLITYHRTDSLNMSAQAVMTCRNLIENKYGNEYLPEKPKGYKTRSKSAQEAHEAIRPTDVMNENVAAVNGGATERHKKLYKLIRNRFIACQMKAAVYDQTSVTVMASNKAKYRLRASGSIMKFDGWRKVYASFKKAAGDKDVILPEIGEQELLDLVRVLSERKETLPPSRYNDASLVKALEQMGIGRPSTYAPIISVLIDRAYIERKERRFFATAVGVTVVKFLKKHFNDVMDYDFTAELESSLDKIADNKKDWRKMMEDFWKPFDKKVKESVKADRVKIPVEKTGEKCPGKGPTAGPDGCKYKGELVVRTGRFGKFLSCDKFNLKDKEKEGCKFTRNYSVKLEGFVCPDCKGSVVQKRTRKGRTFWGCENYAKKGEEHCEWASWTDPTKSKKQ